MISTYTIDQFTWDHETGVIYGPWCPLVVPDHRVGDWEYLHGKERRIIRLNRDEPHDGSSTPPVPVGTRVTARGLGEVWTALTEDLVWEHVDSFRVLVLPPQPDSTGALADKHEQFDPAHPSIQLGGWLSAALDDPAVCDEMKADIQAWFDAGMPNFVPPNSDSTGALARVPVPASELTPITEQGWPDMNVAGASGPTGNDEKFCDAVWEALKGDHNDLRKQAIILRAHRQYPSGQTND